MPLLMDESPGLKSLFALLFTPATRCLCTASHVVCIRSGCHMWPTKCESVTTGEPHAWPQIVAMLVQMLVSSCTNPTALP
ncbi:hypothetical protein F5Y15DRAFT_393250 [Xylariaceae sp. FL0016]|nr:hypothetical protein F5Y15DRAFT_393250 [Xylariaceae sp. FL0016]